MSDSRVCPCGSGRLENECCLKFILGEEVAATAELLMRSRYTAYVTLNQTYLLTTWHQSTRPEQLNLTQAGIIWKGLNICKTQAGQETDQRGVVEFIAKYEESGRISQVHEASRFIYEQGKWFYVDGDIINSEKISRNAKCSCGSGKKFKRCCAQI